MQVRFTCCDARHQHARVVVYQHARAVHMHPCGRRPCLRANSRRNAVSRAQKSMWPRQGTTYAVTCHHLMRRGLTSGSCMCAHTQRLQATADRVHAEADALTPGSGVHWQRFSRRTLGRRAGCIAANRSSALVAHCKTPESFGKRRKWKGDTTLLS